MEGLKVFFFFFGKKETSFNKLRNWNSYIIVSAQPNITKTIEIWKIKIQK